jgi:hypothetical protein
MKYKQYNGQAKKKKMETIKEMFKNTTHLNPIKT